MMRRVAPLSACLLPVAKCEHRTLRCEDSILQQQHPETDRKRSASSHGAFAQISYAFKQFLQSAPDVGTIKQEKELLPVRVSEAVLTKAKELASTHFRPGNDWVWLHRDPSGKPYCWERYSVSAAGNDAEVTIEMSSRFGEDEKYSEHHRMKLFLGECLASKVHHMTWCFREFSYKVGGEWCEAPFRDNVQAFEEKFDLFLMGGEVATDRIRSTRSQIVTGLGSFGFTGLVQTRRHSYTGAWYAYEPPQHAGLAAFKEFVEDHKESNSHYSFELSEMGTNSFGADAQSVSE